MCLFQKHATLFPCTEAQALIDKVNSVRLSADSIAISTSELIGKKGAGKVRGIASGTGGFVSWVWLHLNCWSLALIVLVIHFRFVIPGVSVCFSTFFVCCARTFAEGFFSTNCNRLEKGAVRLKSEWAGKLVLESTGCPNQQNQVDCWKYEIWMVEQICSWARLHGQRWSYICLNPKRYRKQGYGGHSCTQWGYMLQNAMYISKVKRMPDLHVWK